MNWLKRRNKHLLAALALCAGCSAAYAQSSVTLYGLIDDGLSYVTNAGGHTQALQQSSIMRGNRWGLKGAEDLGGGAQAIFVLESGFAVETGTASQGGLEFGRQAYVGLSNSYGSLTLGREYDFIVDYVGLVASSALFNTAYAFHIGDLDRLSGERLDSAIKFSSANFNGFTFGAMYAFGSPSSPTGTGHSISFGGHYANGGFAAGAAYTVVYDQFMPLASDFGITSLFGHTIGTLNHATGVISAASVNIERTQTITLATNYTWQKFFLAGMFTGTNLRVGDSSGNFLTYEVTGQYNITPFMFVSASYAYETFQGNKYGQAAATIDYRFSKATDVYLALVNLRGYSGTNVSILGLTPSTSNMQSVARVGLRHLF